MNQSLKRWLCAGALAAFAASSPAQEAAPESSDPIKLTQSDWTGQRINMTLKGEVQKSMGYNVEYVVADYLAQFAGLESGDLHIAMEIWETTAADALEASLATGNTVDLGETGMAAKEEWWYPLYMKDRCPGLPNWEALLKCGEAFATPETAPKGRYLGGPVTWGGYDDERVEALGLPFEVVHAGTDAALFAEVQSAYERQAPIMAWIYAPHWATAKFEGEWVEFPTYERACYEDPAWGSNTSMAYDCGKPFGWIKKVGWKGGEEKWPAAYKAVRAFTIDNATVSAMIVKVDLEGMSVEDVVKEWMDANQATWQAWTK
jgi:glycine betaine/proline transport system substrate-binding protein